MDLIASRGHVVGVVWFERDKNAATWTEHTIVGELREPHCLAAIDLDRDEDMDVATVAYGSERATWYENDGRGNFKSHLIRENQQAYHIRVIDLDKDGDLDSTRHQFAGSLRIFCVTSSTRTRLARIILNYPYGYLTLFGEVR